MTEYISHPLIKPNVVEKRLYQSSLANAALNQSSLVVLPTGLGKTIVALLVMVARLEKCGGRVLVLAPTKPLVEQHAVFLKSILNMPSRKVLTFTGEISPAERAELWTGGSVVVSTPQVIENDLICGRLSLDDVVLIIFDEAHRAVGNYSYVYIAEKYMKQSRSPLVLGITASPGGKDAQIEEVCQNLNIRGVEVRTESDVDVVPYIHKKDIEWIYVDLPDEIRDIRELVDRALRDRLDELRRLGAVNTKRADPSKSELLQLQSKLQYQLKRAPQPQVYRSISLLAEVLKIKHAMDMIETQGISALKRYFERLQNEARSRGGSKASKRLVECADIKMAMRLANGCDEEKHPKLDMVKQIVEEQMRRNQDSRIIVFTNFRDTAELVTESLGGLRGVRPARFVGQANKYKDRGLSQRKQVEVLRDFKDGVYNVLVGTSVAEEGLDIPSTNLVVFYEPVPSEIRSVQRRGRTGRRGRGRVVVLITRGTRDETYYWMCKQGERNMYKKIHELWGRFEDAKVDLGAADVDVVGAPEAAAQRRLDGFDVDDVGTGDGGGVRVFVDQREMRSAVVKELERLGASIGITTLEVGDYVLSDRVCVERKTAEDFLSSLVDGGRDLFGQLSDLRRCFDRPILVIEGGGLYTKRRIHPNAIRGALGSVVVGFGVPTITTEGAEDTAAFLYVVAKQEQGGGGRPPTLHSGGVPLTLKEQQEYLISSISNIGPVIARRLLLHFGSVQNVMSAPLDDLMVVFGVGPKTAARIREVVGSEYKE
ncbi:MAG: DEAD/DEAH box helicase [Methanocellales archaeon]|nr:DEAD/DEAH box helicase [Methanocellales archaeon]